MNLIERAKNIIITPKTEWDKIAGEATPTQQLIVGYVLPLAGAAAVAGFIGSSILAGLFGGAIGIGFALIGAIIHVVMAVVSVFVLGFIIDALAPTFSGTKNFEQALKVTAYSYTPAWVFGLLAIIPLLGSLAALVGGLYGIYLLYLGLPKLMKAPQEKSVPYLIVVIIAAIVLWAVIAMLSMCVVGGGIIGAGGLLGQRAAHEIRREAASARLEEYGRKMEEANKKMEAASKTGDPNKQMEAAMGALGTALSGGKGVEPLQLDQLKPYAPEKFAGLPRTDMKTERSGVTGFTVAQVQARYGDSAGKDVQLEVMDTGGMAGLMGFASWMGIQGEREDSSHRESTKREGSRIVHESVSKTGGRNEYTVVLADRFVVSAKGNADIGALKSSVASLDLGKLESTK
jgi:hypothetical protein